MVGWISKSRDCSELSDIAVKNYRGGTIYENIP